jgi:arylsulfatase A-like enzyme
VCLPARRTLHTGTSPRTHGLRENAETATPLPGPTLADCFRAAGYQTCGVGKLHMKPQRSRIGFEEMLLDEEGRGAEGMLADDYELFLGDMGHPGQRFAGGMGNNTYDWRPWHLDERLHCTCWTAGQMCRLIRRRDPLRPFFGFLSFSHPHPPMEPIQAYLEVYRDCVPTPPLEAAWSQLGRGQPFALEQRRWCFTDRRGVSARTLPGIQRAFYAMCTHIDHQIKRVIGTLRQAGMLQDTIIAFVADHGEGLGEHGQWAKGTLLESSARIPWIMVDRAGGGRLPAGTVDHRLIDLGDLMPSLLDLAGIPIPAHVEGHSVLAGGARDELYGECQEGTDASRMLRDRRYKYIYYPAGNRRQLFDMENDPDECHDLAAAPAQREVLERLESRYIARLYGADRQWLCDGALVGMPAPTASPGGDIGLAGQMGDQWPPFPVGEVPW